MAVELHKRLNNILLRLSIQEQVHEGRCALTGTSEVGQLFSIYSDEHEGFPQSLHSTVDLYLETDLKINNCSLYEALQLVFPSDINARKFLGTPKFFYKQTLSEDTSYYDMCEDDEHFYLFTIDEMEFYYTSMVDSRGGREPAIYYNVIFEDEDRDFKTPKKAEDFLLLCISHQDPELFKYHPITRKFKIFFGEGYDDQGEDSFYSDDLDAFIPSKNTNYRLDIMKLHVGESMSGWEPDKYMSIVRVL